jgi:lipid II:glycine glycyltransferase (peptidoglycan interpeptide bridge formation enzyme)
VDCPTTDSVSDGFLIKGDLSEQGEKMAIQSFLDYIDINFSGSHSLCTLKERLSYSDISPAPPTQILKNNGYVWLDNTTTKLPCTYVVNLEKPFKEKIFYSMAKNLRNRIRHARKSGARVIVDDKFEYYDDFVNMHIKMIKKFGKDTKKDEYLQILETFQKKIKLFVCFADSELITALLCYYTPTTVYASIGPYKPEAKPYLNNILPMCAAIKDACESGYQYFDMGGTPTENLAIYKEKFGAKRIPLRIYTKEFSKWKVISNNTFDLLKSNGKKLLRQMKKPT